MTRFPRIPLLVVLIAAFVGCQGKELNFLGYSTAPQFDPNIRSVYIPVFKNVAFVTNPHRGIEIELTQAVVEELGRRRSTMKVISDPSRADTELVGTIMSISKTILNRNQQNYTREGEFILTAEVVWRDLRDGRVISNPRSAPKLPAQQFDPSVPQPPPERPETTVYPVSITAVGRFLPELGESNATAQKMAVDQMARKIVDLMEKPW